MLFAAKKGSLAGIVADTFLNETVKHCQYGIDLHTGAIHRSNLPQIRADLDDGETKQLAEAFGVSVLLNSNLRDGSLRQSAAESGTKVLLVELWLILHALTSSGKKTMTNYPL